jgi:hypothetical protein
MLSLKMSIVFATDCTGIDAPLHCIKSILEGQDVDVQYLFASEIHPKLRHFLKTITPTPGIIFNNIKDRSHNEQYSNIDLYVAGFPCQSFSSLGKRQATKDPYSGTSWTSYKKLSPKYLCLKTSVSY